ncbi:hypothetical protein BN946_scf184845.g39 [Trametes cinnabarina]|uniref:Uncharacterized protein n=1 Tax=Pycnoporus cinnabarinus TaxID=5643 RepID=A0A060SFY6_PYCCI|nr:hypothetical protein BN946_scf184845.g39 [Trametes cinnabarina]
MTNVVLAEQGRAGAVGFPPIDLHWRFGDPDASLPVYILVSSPVDQTRFDPHGLHWSLSWEVKPNVWRHVNIVTHRHPDQPPPNPRYVYWGALTKCSGPGTLVKRRILVADMTFAMRKQIEEVAFTVPVMQPNGQWNCQDWLLDLLDRLRQNGLISDQNLKEVVSAARDAWLRD